MFRLRTQRRDSEMAAVRTTTVTGVTRIFSDLHYGDRVSKLRSLPDMRPLFEGASEIILNGDTVDTRSSRHPEFTVQSRRAVVDFFGHEAPATIWLTGNHDPDISQQHAVELRDRRVYVTHGDILFENLVPWGRDATLLSQRISAELAKFPPSQREQLQERFIATRRAAVSIPQRHQSEQNPVKYAIGFAADTIWPPLRILQVLRAWKETPDRASSLLKRYQLPAQVFIMGHTHRLGITRAPDGLVVVNTGSFCPPSRGAVVDVTETQVILREVARRGREFHLGQTIAEFALARNDRAETLAA